MVNKRVLVGAGFRNDVLRKKRDADCVLLQSAACECQAQLNDAPAQNYIRQFAGFAERRGDQEQTDDISEEIETFCSKTQTAAKSQVYAYQEYQREHTYTQ